MRVFIVVRLELMAKKCGGPTEALTAETTSESETIATLPGPIRGSLGREQGESTWDPLNASELAPNSANGLIPSLIAWAESQPPGNAATVSRKSTFNYHTPVQF